MKLQFQGTADWSRVKVTKPGPKIGPLPDSTMSGTVVYVFFYLSATCQNISFCLASHEDQLCQLGGGPQPSVFPTEFPL